MTEVLHNHNVKSQLAKLLAMEDLTVQHRADIKTAMFDVQARVLYLPIWKSMSNDLYDLLVVHEVGHALDTPAEGWMEELGEIAKRVTGKKSSRAVRAAKGFLNVIEDARIDKRQKRRYPGSRRNYIAGYKELLENDFFGTKTRDINSMIFIDRINVHFKGGVAAGVKFSSEEMKFIKRIEDAETFEEVIKLTEEVFAFSKEEMDQPRGTPQEDFEDDEPGDASEWEFEFEDEDDEEDERPNKTSKRGEKAEDEEDAEEGEGEGEESDAEEDEDGEGTKAKGQKDDSEDGEEDAEGEADKDEDGDADAGEKGEGDYNDGAGHGQNDDDADGDDEDGEDNIPESETERKWEEQSQTLVASTDVDYLYVNLPQPNLKAIVADYKEVLAGLKSELSRHDATWHSARMGEMTKWKTGENATISYLIKEFETRKAADTYSKIQIAKTGVINTNRLHSYKYNEDIFRRNTVVPAGKNHGFVMFLDWSGSMNYNINHTMKQLFTLVMFCKRVQIPFEVYTFRDPTEREVNYNPNYGGPAHDHNKTVHTHWTYKSNSIVFDPFKLRNILSSRMTAVELNQMMGYMYNCAQTTMRCEPMGGTPLNAALAIAPNIVEDFQKRTKVQIVNTIVLTDGQSNGSAEIHGWNRVNPTGNKRYTNFIMEDEKLRKTYDLGQVARGYGFSHIDSSKMTTILLQRLKERTNCNLVGFYLTNGAFSSEFRSQFGYGSSETFEKEMKKCWTENGFFPVTHKGYDKYFILSSDMFRIAKAELKIDEKMTKNTITKNFIKFSAGKKVNRVLLRQFIEEIAA
jgi:hypothetical protein